MIQALGGEAQNGPTAQYQAILPDAVRDETEVVTVVLPTIHFQGEPGARESDVKEMDQTIQQHLMIRPLVVCERASQALFARQLREAYMRKVIDSHIKSGTAAGDIVVIVGAYHIAGITPDLEPMSEKELKGLKRTEIKKNALICFCCDGCYPLITTT